jgi:hypothetical protein
MKNFGFMRNKYSVSAIILILCLIADIVLHKGMSRVILPKHFTDKIKPYDIPVCNQELISTDKTWVQAMNKIESLDDLPLATAGLEIDVYFNSERNYFEVFHDSSARSILNADSLLEAISLKKINPSVWFDFKNLTANNLDSSLREMDRLRTKYSLFKKMIVESSNAKYLRPFCKNGFFTSYYVPFFNPYQLNEDELVQLIRTIHDDLVQYPTSAISGYYFQYPVLKKFFPTFPILTWSDKSHTSLINYYFNRQLKNDSAIKIVLFPLAR